MYLGGGEGDGEGLTDHRVKEAEGGMGGSGLVSPVT